MIEIESSSESENNGVLMLSFDGHSLDTTRTEKLRQVCKVVSIDDTDNPII